MSPLFTMANGFVDNLVQISTLGGFLKDNDVETFSDLESIAVSEYVLFVLGFAVCAGIGALLTLILPIAGCSIGCAQCCSCCCSCCGGRTRYRKEDHSRAQEFGCAAALAVITGIMMASVACCYVATEMYRRELDPKTGTLEDILQGVRAVDTYVSQTSHEMNDTVVTGIGEVVGEVIAVIDKMPNDTRDGLGLQTGVQPSLDILYHFTSNLEQLAYALGGIQNSSDQLSLDLANLELNLTDSRRNIEVSLGRYDERYSEEMNQVKNLTICMNYSNFGDANVAKDATNALLQTDIVTKVESGMRNYSVIETVIRDEVEDLLDNMKDIMEDVHEEVLGGVSDFLDEFSKIDVSSLTKDIIEAKPYFEEYGYYAYAAVISMNTVMLLVVVLLALGMIMGLCLPPAEKSSGCCDSTSQHGTRLLTAAASFLFIFSWVLAIMLVVLFVGGGLLESVACRHIMAYDSTMKYLENMLWVEIQGGGEFPFNISLENTMEECKENHSLYQAVSAENNGFNLSELLDLSDVIKELDKLENVTVVLPHVYILDDSVNISIAGYDDSMDTVALQRYQNELSKNITCLLIGDYAARLKVIADQEKDPDLAEESLNLMSITKTLIPVIEEEKSRLQEFVDTAESIYPRRMDLEVKKLAEGERALNNASEEIIGDQIANSADVICSHITNFTDTVEEDIEDNLGRCRSLYDAGVAAVYAPCVYFLYPVNALWFCYGWFLIFSIPAVAIAMQLGDIFKTLAAPPPIFEAMEMEPYGEAQHYPLYYHSKGQTTHFGIHDTIVHPESTASPPAVKPNNSNKVHPMADY